MYTPVWVRCLELVKYFDTSKLSSTLCRYLMFRGKSPIRTWVPGMQNFGSSGRRSHASWWPIKLMVGPSLHLGDSNSWGPSPHISFCQGMGSFVFPSQDAPFLIGGQQQDPVLPRHRPHCPCQGQSLTVPSPLTLPAKIFPLPVWTSQCPTSLCSRHTDDSEEFQFCQEVLPTPVLCLGC